MDGQDAHVFPVVVSAAYTVAVGILAWLVLRHYPMKPGDGR
jgi:hypothetical protein